MILFIFGYFVMGCFFMVLRFSYHLFENISLDNLISEVKNDFKNLFSYTKQTALANPVKIKFIVLLIIFFVIFFVISLQISIPIEILSIFDNFVSMIIYFLMVVIFVPKENQLTQKKFPVEIFGFIYSVVLMYCSAGEFVIEIYGENNLLNEDVWIYGYIVVIISYLICIATLSRFMEHDLSKMEVIFVGMIMMTILEFMTYYGIGFFGGIKFFDPQIFEGNVLEAVTTIINQGIFIASQSQILERSTREVIGYIILNGTDALTVTAVLGYLLQKFMGIKNKNE